RRARRRPPRWPRRWPRRRPRNLDGSNARVRKENVRAGSVFPRGRAASASERMRYRALVCDYDGTVASGGVPDPAARDELARLKLAGGRVVLATGRRLDDLHAVCPEAAQLFDAIVGENGAVLQLAPDGAATQLADPPPPAFAAALRARGVEPLG